MPTGTLTRPRPRPHPNSKSRAGSRSHRRSGRLAGPPRVRRRRWLRWLVALLVLALLGGVVWLLGFSSVLATKDVSVTGAKVLSKNEVRETAAVPLGLPLARQDLDTVAGRVARLAPVERVTVDRIWPDTVVVHVTERTPLLAVKQDVGYALVDADGVAFDEVTSLPAGIGLAEAKLSDRALLIEIGTVATAMPEDVRQTITKIGATSPSQLTVTLASGVTVNWGSADQSKLKAEIVTALLERKPKSIDVSSPRNPAIR